MPLDSQTADDIEYLLKNGIPAINLNGSLIRSWPGDGRTITAYPDEDATGSRYNLEEALAEAATRVDTFERVVVETVPQAVYLNGAGDQLTTWEVPAEVELKVRNSHFRTFPDQPIVFLDTGAKLTGTGTFNSRPSDPYTSQHILLDATQASNPPYVNSNPGTKTAVIDGYFEHFSNAPAVGSATGAEASAIGLVGGPNSGEYVTHNYLGVHNVRDMDSVLGMQADGFLNDNVVWVVSASLCNHVVRHDGDEEAKVQVYGHTQATNDAYLINNGTSTKSTRFWGHLEDPNFGSPGRDLLSGAGIRVENPSSPLNLDTMSVDWGVGTVWNGVGAQPSESGEPVSPNEYVPGDTVYTGGGVYEKGLNDAIDPWIEKKGTASI
jgi:hypothetical protein